MFYTLHHYLMMVYQIQVLYDIVNLCTRLMIYVLVLELPLKA